jgi:hypothetical protein
MQIQVPPLMLNWELYWVSSVIADSDQWGLIPHCLYNRGTVGFYPKVRMGRSWQHQPTQQLPADYNKQGRRKGLDKSEVVLVQMTNLVKQNRLFTLNAITGTKRLIV